MPIFQQVTTEFISFGASVVTLPRPSALQIGDGMVVHISHQNVSADVVPPAGWTDNQEGPLEYVASKVADAADVVAVSFLFNFLPAASPVSSRCASLMSFSGVDSSGFVDNLAIIAQPFFGTSDPIFTPALTASRRALFILSAHSSSSFNRGQGMTNRHTGPAGFTERADGMAFEMGLGVYTRDGVEVLSIPQLSISIQGGFGGNRFQTGVSMAIVGIREQIDAIAVGSPSVVTQFFPFTIPPPAIPPSPPAPVDDPDSGCIFAGIQVGAPVPDVRDDCGVVPRVDDAVEFVGVQAGQAEPVEPVGGFFSLGRVRQRILNPNSVQ